MSVGLVGSDIVLH